MPKILVAFYSRTGTTRTVAEQAIKELGCDSEEILDVKSRKGLFGWLRSGMEAARGMIPAIQDTKKDPSAYDIVVLCTPWWAGKMSSPMRAYVTKNKDKFKQAAFLITAGGADLGKGVENMEQACGKKPAAVFSAEMMDVRAGRHASRLKDFLAKLR